MPDVSTHGTSPLVERTHSVERKMSKNNSRIGFLLSAMWHVSDIVRSRRSGEFNGE